MNELKVQQASVTTFFMFVDIMYNKAYLIRLKKERETKSYSTTRFALFYQTSIKICSNSIITFHEICKLLLLLLRIVLKNDLYTY